MDSNYRGGKMSNNYYEKNKEKVKAKAKEIYEKNKEKILQRRKELYHERHKDYKKEYYLNKGPMIKEKFNITYNTPDSPAKKNRREYYENNKHYLNQKHKDYNYEKYHSDKQFKIKTKLRVRLTSAALYDVGIDNMEPIIGCSIKEFRDHIRVQFAPGMYWGNYGEWELDHIKPVSDFDLTDDAQLKQCYNYINLRPMWSTKNRVKHNRKE